MNIFDIEGGLKVEINKRTFDCKVIRSPKAVGTVFIPRFAEIDNREYSITSINEFSFCGNKIDFLDFPDDSEISTFESNSLSNAFIKKLKIPPNLKNLEKDWCANLQGLEEVEISPGNQNFLYLNNSYLLTKSNEESDKFDVLIYARSDIEDAIVPSQVKTINRISFAYHKKLKSVTF